MSKLGFMQDLIRGIKKIIGEEQEKTTAAGTVATQQNVVSGNMQALLKRGNMALEDGEWERANEFFEEVLNQDAECAEAYIGKMLAKIKQSNLGGFAEYYINKYSTVIEEKLEACDANEEHIEDMVKNYTLKGYLEEAEIRKMYDYDRMYIATYSTWIVRKQRLAEEFQNEKLLARARQYADGDTQNELEGIINSVINVFDEKIANTKNDEETQIASIKEGYANHIAQMDVKVKELYDKVTEEARIVYKMAVSDFDKAQYIGDFEMLKKTFQRIYYYSDSQKYYAKCITNIERLEKIKKAEEARFETAGQKDRKNEQEKVEAKGKFLALEGIVIVIFILLFMVSCRACV
jgi:hypothetical protein